MICSYRCRASSNSAGVMLSGNVVALILPVLVRHQSGQDSKSWIKKVQSSRGCLMLQCFGCGRCRLCVIARLLDVVQSEMEVLSESGAGGRAADNLISARRCVQPFHCDALYRHSNGIASERLLLYVNFGRWWTLLATHGCGRLGLDTTQVLCTWVHGYIL